MLSIILPIVLFLTSVFLILLVLIQRGRGGGLAGAFGGLGGQSAFGTKAGDLFTRITIVVATVWILLCAASVKVLNTSGEALLSQELGTSAKMGLDEAASKAPAGGQDAAPAQGATPTAPADAAPAAADAPAKSE